MAEVIKNVKTFDSSNSTFTTYPVGADAENVVLSETTQTALSDKGIEVSDVDNAIASLANTNSVDDNFLFVTFTGNDTNGYECDYTVSEIWDAYAAGKHIIAKHLSRTYTFLYSGGSISSVFFGGFVNISSPNLTVGVFQYWADESFGIIYNTYNIPMPYLDDTALINPITITMPVTSDIFFGGMMYLGGVEGVFSTDIGVGKITGVQEPVDDTDAVPKSYVDNTINSAITSAIGDVIAASY